MDISTCNTGMLDHVGKTTDGSSNKASVAMSGETIPALCEEDGAPTWTAKQGTPHHQHPTVQTDCLTTTLLPSNFVSSLGLAVFRLGLVSSKCLRSEFETPPVPEEERET